MFNLDKILRRSLFKDTAKMIEKYHCYITIDNGVDFIHVYLTKKELKRLLKKDEVGNDSFNIPDDKIQNLWNRYYRNKAEKKEVNQENICLEDIPTLDGDKYENFADRFTLDEWMKMVNKTHILFRNQDGQIYLQSTIGIENFEIERLLNNFNISDDTIYDVYIQDENKNQEILSLTLNKLRKIAKTLTPYFILHESADSYKEMLTEQEVEKIKNEELILLLSMKGTLLLISTTN